MGTIIIKDMELYTDSYPDLVSFIATIITANDVLDGKFSVEEARNMSSEMREYYIRRAEAIINEVFSLVYEREIIKPSWEDRDERED